LVKQNRTGKGSGNGSFPFGVTEQSEGKRAEALLRA